MGLIENINTITTIPLKSLKDLQHCVNIIHSNSAVTQMREDKNILELETFEGKILISIEDDNIRYKFIPSDNFNAIMVNSIKNKNSLLVKEVEDKLKKILIKTYKDIL